MEYTNPLSHNHSLLAIARQARAHPLPKPTKSPSHSKHWRLVYDARTGALTSEPTVKKTSHQAD